MNTNRPFGAIKLTIALFCLGLVSPISLFGQGCPFPPPTAVNVDACDGGSTLIDLFNQIPPPLPVWLETFDEDGAGVVGVCSGTDPSTCATNNPPANGQWSVTGNTAGLVATSDYFQVIAGQLVARDLDAEVCFTSSIIDISSFTSVDFSADILEMGDHEAADYADITLIVDGTPTMIPNWMGLGSDMHTLVGDNPDDGDWVATTIAALGITGSTLQIEICLFNGAGTENIIIDNVSVADPSNLPGFNFYSDLGLMTLLAGDVTAYDPMTTLITTPDTVWVTTTDGMCETTATEMIVTVSPNPVVVASVANAIVCEGENIELMETGGEANLWSWTGPKGYSSSDQNPIIVASMINSGPYQVTGIIGATGCRDSMIVNVIVNVTPSAPTAEPVFACAPEESIITPTATPALACDLFFSEYIEGSSFNKCVEIFNGTGADIDLSTYSVILYSNGTATPTVELPLSGIITNGDVFVLCNTGAAAEFMAVTDLADNVVNFNGDDAFVLANNGVHIDIIGQVGFDPGSRWGSSPTSTQNTTLVRSSDVICGDCVNDAFVPTDEWTGLPQNDATNLGTHIFNGTYPDPVLFNFYDGDPTIGGVLLAGPAETYTTNAEGTFYVTATSLGCEGPAIAVDVVISQGTQPLSCGDYVNVSLGPDCMTEITPEMMLESLPIFEFVSIELVDASGNVLPSNVVGIEQMGQELTVSVVDICNNNSCWGKILVEDKIAPIVTALDTIVSCGEDTSKDAILYTVEECSQFTLTITDKSSGDLCDQGGSTITRTYIATDIHGNVGTAVQVITILPLELSDITPPNAAVHTTCNVVSMPDIYDYTGDIMDAYPTINGMALAPGEYCNFLVRKKDNILSVCDMACSNSLKVIRTWTIYDWCNMDDPPLEFEQVIGAKDTEGPTLEPFAEDLTISVDPWTCTKEAFVLPLPASDDNCTPDAITFDIRGPVGISVIDGIAYDLPRGTHRFIYVASDCCGNLSFAEFLDVTVVDEIAPIAIAIQDVVVSLVEDQATGEGVAKLFPESIDNFSFDKCGEVTLRIRRERDECRTDSDEYGPYVSFCCEDEGDEHKVWLEVTDESGNVSETWANVLVEDKVVRIECVDLNIKCHDDLEQQIRDNKPAASGICGSLSVVEVARDYDEYNEACDYGIIYIEYQVRDYPKITCTQRVYVEYIDNFSCANVDWPAALTETTCLDLDPADLTWDAGPCELIGWTLDSDTFFFESNSCSKIINNYTVIDWCVYDAYMNGAGKMVGQQGSFDNIGSNYGGIYCTDSPDSWASPNGVYNYLEIIKVIDEVAPEILLCDFDPFPITDGCTTPVTIKNIALDNSECPETWLKWQLTLTTEDGDVYVYNTRTKAGAIAEIDLVDDNGDPLLFTGPMSTHDIHWKVWDGCGNIDICESTFMVVDKKRPTPYCVSLSSAVMSNGQVELWALDFDKGSFDNCSTFDSLRFTFNEIRPDEDYLFEAHYFDKDGIVKDQDLIDELYPLGLLQLWNPDKRSSAKAFNCEDIPSVDVEMTVWDEKFNSDHCLVTIDLIDNQSACPEKPTIAGIITNKDLIPINNVDVTLENLKEGTSKTTSTFTDGSYAFPKNSLFGEYKITPSKVGDIKDGLSTEDVLIIQKFIMDDSELDNPYDIIASDLNNDQRITATDIIFIQRIIVGQTTELKDGYWRFIDASQELTKENALLDQSNTSVIPNLIESMMANDFIGVKMGDVTGDANLGLKGTDTKPRSASSFNSTDRYVNKGDVVTIPINSSDYSNLVGYQTTLSLTGATFIGTEGGQTPLYASNVGVINDREIAISYGNMLSNLQGEHLFSLIVQADKTGKLSEMVSFSNSYIKSEVYTSFNVDKAGLTLEFVEEIRSEDAFVLDQNTPNPFSETTAISFYLPEKGEISLSVFDVTGKKIYFSGNMNLRSGMNTLEVDRKDNGIGTGIYYYTLTYNDESLSRKMIIID